MKAYRIGFWTALLVSFILLFSPISVGGRDGFGLDKIVHAAIFFSLVFFAFRAYPAKKLFWLLLIVCYAFGSEFFQGQFLPNRHFDWYDIASDSAGLILAIGYYYVKNKEH